MKEIDACSHGPRRRVQNCQQGQLRVQVVRRVCSYEEAYIDSSIVSSPEETGAKERLRSLGSYLQGQENFHRDALLLNEPPSRSIIIAYHRHVTDHRKCHQFLYIKSLKVTKIVILINQLNIVRKCLVSDLSPPGLHVSKLL